MQVLSARVPVPVYPLELDEVGHPQFRLYHYEGSMPNLSELLVPHRKDHYLLVFVRHAVGRQWIDTTPYVLQDNTIYFVGPEQVIVKEELSQAWSEGIAFTAEFLSLQENASLRNLPLIQNPQNGHELRLTDADVRFVEDMLDQINREYRQPGDWQQRMLGAYLTVLLTYLSRLYTEQFPATETSADTLLLKQFQAKVDTHFQQVHEVSEYATMLNLSAGYLSEVVKEQSGKPAIKHIHDRLILEARRLLFHTEQALKEIAYELGFADASYFSRFFKRETGVTPAEYRSNIRKMYQ